MNFCPPDPMKSFHKISDHSHARSRTVAEITTAQSPKMPPKRGEVYVNAENDPHVVASLGINRVGLVSMIDGIITRSATSIEDIDITGFTLAKSCRVLVTL